jgi:hypothetical protein
MFSHVVVLQKDTNKKRRECEGGFGQLNKNEKRRPPFKAGAFFFYI